MCGINGVISLKVRDQINPDTVALHKSIANKLSYRGPDASNEFINKNFCLFTSEHKITKIPKTLQPYEYEKKLIIGFNGEIYNRIELVNKVRSYGQFIGDCTEVELIAVLYDLFKEEFLKMIDGPFAITIYNKQSNDIILARDRFGEKPLFYCIDSKFLHFSSEANYLKDSLSSVNIDDDGLLQYLKFGFAFDHLIKGICRIKSGYALIIKDGFKRDFQYWKPVFKPDYSISLDHATFTSLKLLNENIVRMYPDEVKSGVYISGGIDSSIIAKLLNNNIGKIDLFTSGLKIKSQISDNLPVDKDYYYVETKGNELVYTDELAKFVNGPYHKNLFSVNDLITSIDDMVSHLPGGPVMSTSFPLFYFSALKSKGFKVCFTGEGADELNGGYATSQPELYDESISRSFAQLSDYFSDNEVNSFFEGKVLNRLEDIYQSLDREIDDKFEFEGKEIDLLFNKIRFFQLNHIFGPHLLEKADGMTMGKAPTELRMPFLAGDYVQFILNLPQSILRFNGMRKFLVYQMAERIHVPKEIIYRKQKQRTSLPYYQLFFLNKDFKKYVGSVLNKKSKLTDILKIKDPGEYIYNLEGTMNAHKRAWALMVLEIWLKNIL